MNFYAILFFTLFMLFSCAHDPATEVSADVDCDSLSTSRKKMVESMDADGDSKLSLAEFQAGHGKMFSCMDGDKDGFVVADEVKAFHMKMRSKYKGKKSKRMKKGKKMRRSKGSKKKQPTDEAVPPANEGGEE